MCTHVKAETDVVQNLIDDFSYYFDCQRTCPCEGFQAKKYGGSGLLSE